MKLSRDALVLIVLLGIAAALPLTQRSNRRADTGISTSYSNYDSGVKAVYTLLGDRLGYNVDRLLAPYTEMPGAARVLVVVAPVRSSPIEQEELQALDRWIEAGGTALFISDSLQGIPARYGATRAMGKGFIYAINDREVITNKGVKDYRNALKVVNIVAKHAGRDDLVLFDEYHHGLGRSKLGSVLLHTQRQVKTGAAVIAVALLALCYSKGRRFGAVRSLPSREYRRPESEYVESVARLYQKAGAADVAADILINSVKQRLCLKLGLAPDAPLETIARRLESEGHTGAAVAVRRLTPSAQAGQRISKSELMNIARETHLVEKELGLVGSNG